MIQPENTTTALITTKMIDAAARKLSDIQAEACGVPAADNWAMFGDALKEDAQAMLEAAFAAEAA